jgi:hypothetical protein
MQNLDGVPTACPVNPATKPVPHDVLAAFEGWPSAIDHATACGPYRELLMGIDGPDPNYDPRVTILPGGQGVWRGGGGGGGPYKWGSFGFARRNPSGRFQRGPK